MKGLVDHDTDALCRGRAQPVNTDAAALARAVEVFDEAIVDAVALDDEGVREVAAGWVVYRDPQLEWRVAPAAAQKGDLPDLFEAAQSFPSPSQRRSERLAQVASDL
jgi:hypothetical protein